MDKRIAAVSEVRAILSLSLAPLQYVVSWPIQFIDTINHVVSSHDELIKENLALKAQTLLLQSEVQRLRSIESQNNQLMSLVNSSTKAKGKILIAQLLAVDTDPFIKQMTLDKGSSSGVFVGQPVLDAYGVMGQVIQTSAFTSRVLLLNDSHSGIPAQLTRNGIRAIAVGDNYSGKLRLINVAQTQDVKVGDMVVTSGLGEHYPEGYPIGHVTAVVKDPGLQFLTITLEPEAHLDRGREVLLVWPNQSLPKGGKS